MLPQATFGGRSRYPPPIRVTRLRPCSMAAEWLPSKSGVILSARIGAALAMRVEDVYVHNKLLWVRLREKGGKRHEIPCHHTLEEYLHAYIVGVGISSDAKSPLFRTIQRGTGQLSITPLPQANAYAMVRRRAIAASIDAKIGNHTFRATGITAYQKKRWHDGRLGLTRITALISDLRQCLIELRTHLVGGLWGYGLAMQNAAIAKGLSIWCPRISRYPQRWIRLAETTVALDPLADVSAKNQCAIFTVRYGPY
jgi:hypothetical protein